MVFLSLLFYDIVEFTYMIFMCFFYKDDFLSQGFKSTFKGVKEEPMMWSWNWMLKLFLVMELVCGKDWIDEEVAPPICISLLEWCDITLLSCVKILRGDPFPVESWMGMTFGERKANMSVTKISSVLLHAFIGSVTKIYIR